MLSWADQALNADSGAEGLRGGEKDPGRGGKGDLTDVGCLLWQLTSACWHPLDLLDVLGMLRVPYLPCAIVCLLWPQVDCDEVDCDGCKAGGTWGGGGGEPWGKDEGFWFFILWRSYSVRQLTLSIHIIIARYCGRPKG